VHLGVEREQRSLQVAARGLVAGRRAEVAAERRLPADLDVREAPRGSAASSSSAIVVVAPIVVRPCSLRTPDRPARPISSARRGLRRPWVISGMTIVPPATTVTSEPSPKALTASSRDPATITCGASTTPIKPSLSDGNDGTSALIHDAHRARHRLSLATDRPMLARVIA